MASLRGHRNPRSEGIREDIYCAVSTSIPSGYSSLLYPRQAVRIVERVPSVPKVAINVHPRFSRDCASIEERKFLPRSSLIFLRISGRLEGQRSRSISPSSTRSLFKSHFSIISNSVDYILIFKYFLLNNHNIKHF